LFFFFKLKQNKTDDNFDLNRRRKKNNREEFSFNPKAKYHSINSVEYNPNQTQQYKTKLQIINLIPK
jgi:hypothetical protein